MFIKIETFYDSDETEIRLPFYRYFSKFWDILVVFALKFFVHRHGIRNDLKSFVS